MQIEFLYAHQLRNLETLSLTPSERFNVFVGNNGQGKTNLLEAIFCIAALRSFRTTKLSELIRFGAPACSLAARVRKDSLTRKYEVEIAEGSKRTRIDDKAIRPVAKYFGGFNVVVFTPEDLALPRGSPGDRRRFLDRGVFNLDASYLGTASEYDKVVKTRNSVLRQCSDGKLSHANATAMLDIYDEQLAHLAVTIVDARRAFLAKLRPILAATFTSITRTGHTADARYVATTEGMDVTQIAARLAEKRGRDLVTLQTHIGPHRDDVTLMLDEVEAGSFASQGQLRAILLAWKAAELAVLREVHGDAPILLLDDVSSELDPSRNEFLFEHLATLAGQCFITTTDGAHVLLHRERANYRIEGGRILE